MQLANATCPATPVAPRDDLDLAMLLGPQAWARLPAAVQQRFRSGHTDACYRGTLALHCSRLGRCFAWLSALVGGPLTPLHNDAVPTEVRVGSDGRGGVVWERHLQPDPSAAPRIVRSTKCLGGHGGLVERTDGGLSMDLDVFEEDGALVFRSRRYWLALGALQVPVAAWLSPGTCRVEHRDLGGGRFRFTLSMVHPWWGRTFFQSGIFADPQEDLA